MFSWKCTRLTSSETLCSWDHCAHRVGCNIYKYISVISKMGDFTVQKFFGVKFNLNPPKTGLFLKKSVRALANT